MKRMYLPIMFDGESFVAQADGGTLIPITEVYKMYSSVDDAKAAAQKLSLRSPSGRVVIFESYMIVEPRKVEFAEKMYSDKGELLV